MEPSNHPYLILRNGPYVHYPYPLSQEQISASAGHSPRDSQPAGVAEEEAAAPDSQCWGLLGFKYRIAGTEGLGKWIQGFLKNRGH